MICTGEGAGYRLYNRGLYTSFVHGRVPYIVRTRSVLWVVCTREGGICRFYTAGCYISLVQDKVLFIDLYTGGYFFRFYTGWFVLSFTVGIYLSFLHRRVLPVV